MSHYIKKRIIGSVCILLALCLCCKLYQKSPFVSVVIPTYNRENLLQDSINSILEQTYTNFELIVINDASTDNTKHLLKEYAKKDERIKILTHHKNEGVVAGRNEGIKYAKGKYIITMDDDYYSYPDRIEKQVEYMENNPDIIVAGSLITENGKNIIKGSDELDQNKIKIRIFCGWTSVAHPSTIIRKSFLLQNSINYNENYKRAEDLKLYNDVIRKGGKIAVIPEILLKYNIHRFHKDTYYQEQKEQVSSIRNENLNFIYGQTKIDNFCECIRILHENKDAFGFNKESIQDIRNNICKM